MSDSWIDKKELNDLVSELAPGRALVRHSAEDIFDDIPSLNLPRGYQQQGAPIYPQHPVYAPSESSFQIVQQPSVPAYPPSDSPLQVLVKKPRVDRLPQLPSEAPKPIASPFALDDDDDEDDIQEINSQIENLATETARALRVLEEIRNRVDANGLIAPVAAPEESKINLAPPEKIRPQDRIPLDVQVDAHLSLKGRLRSLAEILKTYIGMEEMLVVDRDGFALFASDSSEIVRRNESDFLKAIQAAYTSIKEARQHTCSQLAVENGKWLCLIPTDGEINGQFLLKGLLSAPLDRPEIYVLVELLNEVLRPEPV
jgi:hypothetical protein